jgi:hypothetical protein
MRIGLWTVAILGVGLAAAAAAQEAPASHQNDSMPGMDMGNSASPEASKSAVPSSGAMKPMEHCQCPMMKPGGAMAMEHDDGMKMGGGSAAAMNHSGGEMQCMGMIHKTETPVPAGVLRVSFGGKPTDWTLAQLAALPHKTITLFNSHAKANQTYSGVPLMDLLAKAGVAAKPHGKDLALYLMAVGSDGYVAVYAAAEVNPDVHEGTVLVADAMDGKPLAGEGPLKLVATGDTRPARWVRNLAQVKVETAQ